MLVTYEKKSFTIEMLMKFEIAIVAVVVYIICLEQLQPFPQYSVEGDAAKQWYDRSVYKAYGLLLLLSKNGRIF